MIATLVDAYVEAAKGAGVHGRVAVYESREGARVFYVIEVSVPAGETVASRATKPRQ